VLAALVGCVAKIVQDGRFGDGLKVGTEFSFVPFTALGVAISLFLGFHNNSSYTRWWEARTLWGGQIMHMRNLTRFLLSACGKSAALALPEDGLNLETYQQTDWRYHVVMLTMAQTHALRSQLRPYCRSDTTSALEDRNRFLTTQEVASLQDCRNPANTILIMCSTILCNAELPEYTRVHASKLLERLCEIQAGCERIHSTPLPFVYSLLVHRTAFLYVFLAPFSLAQSMGWWTAVFSAILAYTFFGLDEVARQIQEPFLDEEQCLALSAMCRTIEIDACEALGKPVPLPLKPHRAVLM
jgi:ion channel-forming bestrophin family protein